MRLTSLHIQNFRAVKQLSISNLSDMIIIAGPNGCGKSSLFDAVRLLKSAYGQYEDREWMRWFEEFHIPMSDLKHEAHSVLHDHSKPLVIHATATLSDPERQYLAKHGPDLIEKAMWKRILRSYSPDDDMRAVSPLDKRVHEAEVKRNKTQMMEALQKELPQGSFIAELKMTPSGEWNIRPSFVLELVFGVYLPSHLGIVDYYGSSRSYRRERVATVNLSVGSPDQHRRHALYNTHNKYTNLKTEMASEYVSRLLATHAGHADIQNSDLIDSLKELFATFFPDKEFLGPRPTADGRLEFPVRLPTGREHDIDDLSSGEKEVLLGYLRLRQSTPRGSVILLDEPELHLNPRLIRGLPSFYHKHVGQAMGNQLWLITHSDTLLREAVEDPSLSVYHMQSPQSLADGENQLQPVSGTAEIERAVMDLVGDLATYSPRSKIVLLEGGGDSEVDKRIIQQLFPEFADRVNLVSSGNKAKVRELHDLLDNASQGGRLDVNVFSIVDHDQEHAEELKDRRFRWDAYHT